MITVDPSLSGRNVESGAVLRSITYIRQKQSTGEMKMYFPLAILPSETDVTQMVYDVARTE